MIHYRSFRNTDPPLYVDVWKTSLTGRRTIRLPNATLAEYFTFAKPYFDPKGLIFALDDNKPVGMVHAGFCGNAAGTALDFATGVICLLAVVPSHRRQGVGSALLLQGEEYLRNKGATEILFGSMAPSNPYQFGLDGGCDSAGVVASEPLAGPFLEKRGYQVARSCGIFQRQLERMHMPNDPRFQGIRQRFDIIQAPYTAGWWRESVLGPIEAVSYRLQEKQGERIVAQAILWDMDMFTQAWGSNCVGMIDLEVHPDFRRQGMARYLLGNVMRHVRQQGFLIFEVRADLDAEPFLNLLHKLEFQQVETGHTYRRTTPDQIP